MELWHSYSPELPDFMAELAALPEMQRLAHVGMNCGCEYTNFTHFRHIGAYSRLEHSLGVGLIVWNFTHDKTQAAAGLLHDIATPVFAHVIDFLNGDHMTQESTENGTAEIILDSAGICSVLSQHGIHPAAVTDYHMYPIADNDSPRLSADRLEYTLGNMVNYGFAPFSKAIELYSEICAGINEHGEPELMFTRSAPAFDFARYALQCSRVYVCDEDRYSMQMCAELIAEAVRTGVVSRRDLMLTEPEFIAKLCSDSRFKARWERYCSYTEIIPGREDDPRTRVIKAKKRYIDPYVMGSGRVSSQSPEHAGKLREFLQSSQENMICGI